MDKREKTAITHSESYLNPNDTVRRIITERNKRLGIYKFSNGGLQCGEAPRQMSRS